MNAWKKIVTLTVLLAGTGLSTVIAFTGSYEQSISVDGQEIASFRVTAKDQLIRTEFLKGEDTEIVLKNENGIFRYIPKQNVALKLPDVEAQTNLLDDLDRYIDFLNENEGKKVGQEKVGDYETDVYEFKDPITQNAAKAWVWTEKQFPIKIEVNAPEGILTILISKVNLGGEVDNALFELPSNIQIVDLENTLNQTAQQPAVSQAE